MREYMHFLLARRLVRSVVGTASPSCPSSDGVLSDPNSIFPAFVFFAGLAFAVAVRNPALATWAVRNAALIPDAPIRLLLLVAFMGTVSLLASVVVDNMWWVAILAFEAAANDCRSFLGRVHGLVRLSDHRIAEEHEDKANACSNADRPRFSSKDFHCGVVRGVALWYAWWDKSFGVLCEEDAEAVRDHAVSLLECLIPDPARELEQIWRECPPRKVRDECESQAAQSCDAAEDQSATEHCNPARHVFRPTRRFGASMPPADAESSEGPWCVGYADRHRVAVADIDAGRFAPGSSGSPEVPPFMNDHRNVRAPHANPKHPACANCPCGKMQRLQPPLRWRRSWGAFQVSRVAALLVTGILLTPVVTPVAMAVARGAIR